MRFRTKQHAGSDAPRYPGIPTAVDGSTAVVEMETAAGEAAGAYPITPSTQMGEGWAVAAAAGSPNVHGRQLIFFEPEGEHAAAAVTAGMSMVGLRATNFSSGQGIAYMHESLYAAVGKRLTYVLNVACRAMTKHALNVHAGHDDYHAVDDTGFFQLFAKDAQEAADLNLVAHRIAELALNPGICAQDGFLTSHVIESVRLPERELVKEYLGSPGDIIESPTPAQRLVFGEKRRRIPEMFDLDYPAMLGVVQNQDSYAQGVGAQRPFYFDHLGELTDQALAEFAALTGRHYARATGYRLDDAEFALVGQGSVVTNAEAVVDYLRDTRKLKVGVLNVTMFRPFPADLITGLLRGKKGVTVLERLDQPLAVDPPLLREIRAAVGKALENGRARGAAPYPELVAYQASDVPDFFSGCFGLGSRDLQPGHLMAAVENMAAAAGERRRQYYLGIDFVRPETRLPKLQLWQEKLLDSYPNLAELALPSVGDVNLMPRGSVSLRIHSVGGWGAITMGKNVAMTAADLLGLYIKANPKYGSEKKGQPTTFFATLSPEPVRINCELRHVEVVLSPDPNVFRHSDPLAGLADGGVFIIQSDQEPEAVWKSLPPAAQRRIRSGKIRVYFLDAFKIASDEASDAELRYRMQGAAFMGAFFRVAPLPKKGELTEETLFDGIRAQLVKKFGHAGDRVVEDNLRVIRRGFHEIRELDTAAYPESEEMAGANPMMPAILDGTEVVPGIGNPGRFWEQVCHLYRTGQDGIADPFAGISAIPAATSTIRDMTDVRFEVPEFVADKCTGCSQCWVQCPDAAIPAIVTEIEDVFTAAIASVSNGHTLSRVRQIVPHLSREIRRIIRGVGFTTFANVATQAYGNVVQKLSLDPERRAALDAEFGMVFSALADAPLAKTAPFFDLPERKEKDSGGLLAITISPDACKGCNLCVDVCPEGALVTVKQDELMVEKLRRNWELWEHLPETHPRYVNIASLEEGIGVLPSLLLRKANYRSMWGGDGACMGCGEKTAIHLVFSAVNALMLPRVERHVARLDGLIQQLDDKARALLASDADLEALLKDASDDVGLSLEPTKRATVARLTTMIRDLRDLRWRYTQGPSGKGRSTLGITNATGCSSVWGSTYPYNPYPFPWVNHLFQDSPSLAIGIFEGHMRKMADGFIAIRRAELELAGTYDPEVHEPSFSRFDWRQFTDDEFQLCPPIFAVGGDGAMLDIGFQNLSRLLASGKPIRVVVLDTQVYSNTGGQACTSGFLGQVSDMAAYGGRQHGKEEVRKELSLVAIAHRNAYVLQSSQAAPSHLLGGVLRGLQSRRPAVFALHCPCPPEHGIGDAAAANAARLSLESRAFPLLLYDPDAGPTMPERLSLDGNPSVNERWPTYELKYVDDAGNEQVMALPVTIADWAATEGRFKRHFRMLDPEADDDTLVPFHEYLDRPLGDRVDQTPFIYSIDADRRLRRIAASAEIVALAEERLHFWSQLQQMAAVEIPPTVRDQMEGALESELEEKLAVLRRIHEAQIADLKANYPRRIARRLAEGLLRASGNGSQTVGELLERAESMPGLEPMRAGPNGSPEPPVAPTPAVPAESPAVAVAPVEVPQEREAAEEERLVMEPYIDSALCTTCDECTNLNNKMFAYNDKKQAYIKDARAGTFRELVLAAEKCPVAIIHPGTPLNPKEKDLEKWIKRADPFN